MSIIIYTKYLQENAIFLQECVVRRFINHVDVNNFLKEILFITKYLEYLSFFSLDNPIDFLETDEYKKIMSYSNELYDEKLDNHLFYNETRITDTQKNIRQLVDNVIIDKYFKPYEKR